MKNLDLNGFGIQEMNAEEMRLTEGGFPWVAIGIFIAQGIIWDTINDIEGSANSFKKGLLAK